MMRYLITTQYAASSPPAEKGDGDGNGNGSGIENEIASSIEKSVYLLQHASIVTADRTCAFRRVLLMVCICTIQF